MRWAALIVVLVGAGGAWLWHGYRESTPRPASLSSAAPAAPPAPETIPSVTPRTQSSANSSRAGATLASPVLATEPEVVALTPDQRAELRAAQEDVATMIYGDLQRELHLTAEQYSSIHALAVEYMHGMAERPPAESADQRREAMATSSARFRDDVAAVLDDGQQVQFDEYRRSLDARTQVGLLGMMLADAKLPMDEEQRRGFIQAAIRNGAFINEDDYARLESEASSLQRFVELMQQRDQLLLQSASGVLSDAQLRKLRRHFEETHQAFDNSMYVGN
jgi:hypothetical protein